VERWGSAESAHGWAAKVAGVGVAVCGGRPAGPTFAFFFCRHQRPSRHSSQETSRATDTLEWMTSEPAVVALLNKKGVQLAAVRQSGAQEAQMPASGLTKRARMLTSPRFFSFRFPCQHSLPPFLA